MWGVVPAAGLGSRIQPLAFSKELLPVGSRLEGGTERPRAVTEYLLDRMVRAGASRICLVISPTKGDIVSYFGGQYRTARLCYAVQTEPLGLCDALFRALPFVPADEDVLIGLPDTIWFPEEALSALGPDPLSFLLFPVERPELFDAVVTGRDGLVEEIEVKQPGARTSWIWGALRVRVSVLGQLQALWLERGRSDAYLGTLVNAWIARGGRARGVRAGAAYVDVGTLGGYRAALRLLGEGTGGPPVSVHSEGARRKG